MGGGTHLLSLKDAMCFLGEEVQTDSLGMGSLLIGNIFRAKIIFENLSLSDTRCLDLGMDATETL